tara:strand:+ start:3340 stop:4095 length:756 start_codon:yes stop_codon:yes gene_type:complete
MKTLSSYDLSGSKALVTGASKGIGEACAKALADAGAELLLVSRTKKALEEVKSKIDDSGGKSSIFVADISSMESIKKLRTLGPFNILVNNAGSNIPEHFCEVSEKNFDNIMTLNVKSNFFVAQVVAKAMIESDVKGSIINISSQMGITGGKNRSVYCCSKHAMEGFSKSMALDLAHYGIRVNTVCPTYIETDMTRPFFKNKDFKNFILNRMPLGKVGKPEDVAGAVLYLASESSKMVTGSSIKVDGGWTAA